MTDTNNRFIARRRVHRTGPARRHGRHFIGLIAAVVGAPIFFLWGWNGFAVELLGAPPAMFSHAAGFAALCLGLRLARENGFGTAARSILNMVCVNEAFVRMRADTVAVMPPRPPPARHQQETKAMGWTPVIVVVVGLLVVAYIWYARIIGKRNKGAGILVRHRRSAEETLQCDPQYPDHCHKNSWITKRSC